MTGVDGRADRPDGTLRHLVLLLLRPDRGRLHNTLTLVAGVLVVLAIWETFRIPGTAIACYVILFMARPDRTSTFAGALLLGTAAVLAVLLAVLILVAGLSEPALRIGLMALLTFGTASFAQVPRIGLLFFGLGFLTVEALTSTDSITGLALSPGVYGNANSGAPQILSIPAEEALLHGVLWMMLEFGFPCLMLMLLSRLVGLDPARLLQGGIDDRLALVDAWCRGAAGAAGRLEALARRGSVELTRLAGLAAKEHGADQPVARAEATIHATMRLMLCCLASERLRPGVRPGWAAAVLRCRAGDDAPAAAAEEDPLGAEALRLVRALRHGLPVPDPVAAPGAGGGILRAANFPYGFKVMLAVMTCYVANNALDWTSIGTSVTTCFVVSLGTLGESGHKMVLRVCGCLAGGALGIGSVVFLMPLMTDIGHLMLLFAAVIFVAAWIACGNERIAYSGLQLGLAFLVTVLDEYGPTTDIEGARNRLAGILLGIVVTYLVFALVWPVRVDRLAARRLAEAMTALARMLRLPAGDAGRAQAEAAFAAGVVAAQALLRDEPFEADPRDGAAASEGLARQVQELILPVIMLAAAPAPDPAREPLAAWLEAAAGRVQAGRFGRDGLPPAPALPDGPARRARLLLHQVFAALEVERVPGGAAPGLSPAGRSSGARPGATS